MEVNEEPAFGPDADENECEDTDDNTGIIDGPQTIGDVRFAKHPHKFSQVSSSLALNLIDRTEVSKIFRGAWCTSVSGCSRPPIESHEVSSRTKWGTAKRRAITHNGSALCLPLC